MAKLTRWIWIKGQNASKDRFCKIFEDEKTFDEKFIRRLDEHGRELQERSWSFVKINLVIIFALIINLFVEDLSIPVLQMSVKNVNQIKEVLLLVSALLGFANGLIVRATSRIRDAIEAWIELHYKDNARQLAALSFSTGTGLKGKVALFPPDVKYVVSNWLSRFLILSSAFIILVAIFGVILLGTGVHIAIILDIINNPSLPKYYSWVVVGFVLALDIFAILSLIIENVPLPFEDYRLVMYLSKLRETDPKAHKDSLRRISKGEDLWPEATKPDDAEEKKP